MSSMMNHRNVYKKSIPEPFIMPKKEVTVSLDEEIVKKVDTTCQASEFEIKRSTFVNGVLKEYFKKKEGQK